MQEKHLISLALDLGMERTFSQPNKDHLLEKKNRFNSKILAAYLQCQE